MKILRPIQPTRGLRNTDAYGSGAFGASRDGGARKHLGRDYISVLGDPVVAPVAGKVRRIIERCYPDNDTLKGLEIGGERATVKLLYVEPGVTVGLRVEAGDIIGTAQDVAAYHEARSKKGGRMTNHVHCELRIVVDPEDYTS